MAAYLTLTEFKSLMVIPNEWVDSIEAVDAGFTADQLAYWSDWIDTRLRKRYAVPFALPAPFAIRGWLARIVTVRVSLRRGVDPTDQQFAEIKADDLAAREEIKEAADSQEGLFDLPLRADGMDTSAIVRGAPRVYSEQSPYVGSDQQRAIGRYEDDFGGGTGG